jgi:hypothetical protein
LAACIKREIAAGRTARDRNAIRVNVKSLRPFPPQPAERILDVLNDRRELCLWREAVIERYEYIAVGEREVFHWPGEVLTMSHDQCAAVERHHDRPHPGVVVMVNIRLDAERADLFVSHGFLLKLVGGLQIEPKPKRKD